MKHLKNFFVFLLALVMLCSIPIVHVRAAENQTMSTNAFVDLEVEKGDAKVRFVFDYSDGNSVKLAAVWNQSSGSYDMAGPPTETFSGDTCYASIVLVNKTTGAKVTLRAKCDIYGELDSY